MYFRSWQHASCKMTEKRKMASCSGFLDYQTFTVEAVFWFSSRKALFKLLSSSFLAWWKTLGVIPPAAMVIWLENQAASTYCTYGALCLKDCFLKKTRKIKPGWTSHCTNLLYYLLCCSHAEHCTVASWRSKQMFSCWPKRTWGSRSGF